MKSLIKIFALSIVINITSWIKPQTIIAQEVSVSFQVFYDDLSPYGTWVNSPEYGYVWLPDVEAGFTPYGTNGYWILTDAGWTWVSNYSWGWAPFHYGRWYTDPMYGPMWVPGNEWGPGWVIWRQSEGYYGWAPMVPGISIDLAYSNNYDVPYDHWRFVRDRDFGRENINNYYVDNSTNVTIIKNSTVINNTYVDSKRNAKYNSGPQRTEVEKHAGKVFAPVAIKESSKHGESMGKGELQLYRPQVQKSLNTGTKEAPVKVANLKDLKTPVQKTDQPVKQQPTQPQQKSEPNRQEPIQPKKNNQPNKQETTQPQQKSVPNPQQPQQKKNPNQPAKQQQAQPQQKAEPTRQQPVQPKKNNQPEKQQPNQPQQKSVPTPQQPPQQMNPNQPTKQQQQTQPQQKVETPRQQKIEPNRQQPTQPEKNDQPNREQPNSPQNTEKDKHPH